MNGAPVALEKSSVIDTVAMVRVGVGCAAWSSVRV